MTGTPVDPALVQPVQGAAAQGQTTAVQGTAGTPAAASVGTGGGWSPRWERIFADLKLNPADIDYLRTSGMDDQQLASIATELGQQPLLGGGSNELDASTGAAAIVGAGQPGTGGGRSAWTRAWEKKFRDLLTRSGMKPAEIDAQLAEVRDTPLTGEQIQQVYDQMNQSLGAWTPDWERRFRTLMTGMKVPAADIDTAIAQLSSGGFDAAKLQQIHDEMASQQPGDWKTWERKFKALALPEEMLKSLSSSPMPDAAYSKLYDQLTAARRANESNGRLKKLTEAGATAAERWGVIVEADPNGGLRSRKMSDKDFQKALDGIHSAHVPMWKRIANIALDFIPGVGTLEYLTGKQWLTGDRIDRTNPLNIGMAVLSAIPVIGWAKGAVSAVRGAAELGTVVKAASAGTEAAVGGGALVKLAGEGSALADTFKVMAGGASIAEGAAITGRTATSLARIGTAWSELSAGQRLMKAVDIARMVTPGVNRFGVAKDLFQLGKGYYQASQFATAFAGQVGKLGAIGADGEQLIAKLPGLAKAEASGALTAAQQAEINMVTKITGMTPGEIQTIAQKVGPALEGQGVAFRASTGLWRFNPMKNQATVSVTGAAGQPGGLFGRIAGTIAGGGSTAGMETVTLGRGIGGGLRGALSTADFANIASGLTGTRLAEMGTRLGVGAGQKFRVLAQLRRIVLPGSEQMIMADASRMAHAGSGAWAAASWAGNVINRNLIAPSLAMLGAGLVSGQMRPQSQAMWDYYRPGGDRAAMEEQQRRADAAYASQQAELDQAYQQYVASQPAGEGDLAQAG